MNHSQRDIICIFLNLIIAKLFIFIDESFANNKDMNSQLKYEIIIANEIESKNVNAKIHANTQNYFIISDNIIH